jgi:hypothetical protein
MTVSGRHQPLRPGTSQVRNNGSEQEFDGSPILCCLSNLLKFYEFGIGHGHALGLQQ